MAILFPPTYNFSQSSTAVTFTIPFWPGSGEPFLIGSRFGDRLFGSSGGDKISGGDGADFIDGRAGRDFLGGGNGRDEIHGGDGGDLITGGADGDYLFGEAGFDAILGDLGNDFLWGGTGSDMLRGGDGADELNGDEDGDYLDGETGDDLLRGGQGDDALYGSDGNDSLHGDDDNDHLDGGSGDDLLLGGHGADSFVGGAGADDMRGDDAPPASAPWTTVNSNDVARYIGSASGVEITLTTTSYWSVYWEPSIANYAWSLIVEGWGTGVGGDADGDTLYSIENIDGSQFDDILRGNEFDNVFLGLDGQDQLDGGNGGDTLLGGNGDDVIYGGDGNDVIHGGGVLSRSLVDPPNLYWPGAAVQNFTPLVQDVTDYDESQWWLTNGDDYLSGGAGDDIMRGGGGEDTLVGGDGFNEMYGGDGDDLFIAGRDAEIIDGDVRYENFAPGVLKGDPTTMTYSLFMSDAINDDTVSYETSEQGVTIVFSMTGVCLYFDEILGNGILTFIPAYSVQTAVGVGGHADGDQLYSIEHVIGSAGNDHIVGTLLFGNRFEGRSGDDYLSGMGGGDNLVGGYGFDTLVGSGGIDAFIYEFASEASATIAYGGGRISPALRIEEIKSFTGGQDKIDLAAIDANATTATNDPFLVGSTHFSGVAGELLFNPVARNASGDFIYIAAGDTDGDKLADMMISVEMTGGTTLSAGDFVL